jgi:hypothetical protein
MPGEEVAGDWEETRGAPGQGEDPEGAVGDHGSGEGATERDATEGEDASTGTADTSTAASGDGDPADPKADAQPPSRDDAVGSRMPGHPSGGDD